MQNQINYFYDFCKKWRLKVNIEKSKVLFFSNGRLPNNIKFNYNDKELKIVAHFSYLGIVFSKTGSFNIAKTELIHNYGIKAMYEVLRKGRIHNSSIKCQLDLF